MEFFDLDPADLSRRHAAHTAREIAQQPDVWPDVHAVVDAQRAALDAFLAPLLADPRLRIVLTGAGSSAFIGQCLAPALRHRFGGRVEAVATTDIVANPGDTLQPGVPTLLVSFARSGNSPESVAAVELADRLVDGCRHLAFTCAADGMLNRRLGTHPRAHVVLLPEATHDQAFAMTSSFSGMLLGAAWAFGVAGMPVGPLADAARTLLRDHASRLAAHVRQLPERVVYLGSGTLLGLAREAALKLLELTDGLIVAMAESPLGFRHGPKTFLDERTLVVVLLSGDPHTRRYDLDLLRELRRENRAAGILSVGVAPADDAGDDAGDTSTPSPSGDDLTVPLPPGLPDLALAPVALVLAQCFALLASLRLGLTPDNPSASGTVNRVVAGVTIHPYAGQPT
ncbi:SIS domain-containing protein [Burkholderia cenocepacia]|uniref:SIS domain-containing protein n=1 Tax=Burkholderia TaxID=32008 RepID=UPI00078D8871|nr:MULTISPECIES: SIS domain-containing protein [Burkholderia]AMU18806.1 tagatose-6-phosphate ketose isomerase [Burkholderia cenocepacia]MBJ9696038.1 SIS domain-containing protein [Burkholderia cenocepacia]MBR8478576.1 SIS domain-containing protein [Burkholderia cenocepacia]MCW3584559.1 SIS domain-containing protein [Burkholderia cenocepacia]MCW3629908.1 SIS domain-containing protein [Burkholderia cenocepacia]